VKNILSQECEMYCKMADKSQGHWKIFISNLSTRLSQIGASCSISLCCIPPLQQFYRCINSQWHISQVIHSQKEHSTTSTCTEIPMIWICWYNKQHPTSWPCTSVPRRDDAGRGPTCTSRRFDHEQCPYLYVTPRQVHWASQWTNGEGYRANWRLIQGKTLRLTQPQRDVKRDICTIKSKPFLKASN